MAESLTYEAETQEIFMYGACFCAIKKETNKICRFFLGFGGLYLYVHDFVSALNAI